jgi:RNA polymerase sigma factor (sigma-70 family)
MINTDDVVERCKNGEQAAFALLYKTHAKEVYNTIHRLVNHTAEAEDLLQECFITAYKNIEKFESRSSVKTWIQRIAINHSIDSIRKKKVYFGEINENSHSIADDVSVDEEEFELRVNEVKKAILNLPTGYRTVVSLYLFEGIPQEDIGKMLGISHSTVRTQYKKAKEKIWLQLKSNNSDER